MGMDDHIEILLVEDNPNDAELALRAIKKNNLYNQVLLVTDGDQALDFIYHTGAYAGAYTHNSLKCIILDLKLPKVAGIEVIRKLKSDEKTKVIPIIVLTSSAEERDVIESYGLGVNSYVEKPVDFDQFVKTVAAIGSYWFMINRPPII
jgi:two-component system, response regulator